MNLFNQTSISTGTSIYLIVCLCRVVVLEKNVVNQLWVDGHRQSASMISLLIIFICCVTELLVCLSVFVTCLTYADVVERLNVYRTVLDLQQTVHQFRFFINLVIWQNPDQYNQIIQSWESSDECESDDDDPAKANVSLYYKLYSINVIAHNFYKKI